MKTSIFHGLLVVDKPGGMTSRAVVDRAQGWFPRGTRLGHTGTLDPLATGVLVLTVGSATRLSEYVQQMTKTYHTTIQFGARSDTDDADGTLTPVETAVAPHRTALESTLTTFIGQIDQVPPAYSAAKVEGRRAYAMARSGAEVSLQARSVSIARIDVQAYTYPRLELAVTCGKGTYIRSLARDLGERLGCGAYVETLRRLRVGPFNAQDGITLEVEPAEARERLLPLAAAMHGLPHFVIDDAAVIELCHGRALPLPRTAWTAPMPAPGAEVGIFDRSGNLLAVGRVGPGSEMLLPAKVLRGPGRKC